MLDKFKEYIKLNYSNLTYYYRVREFLKEVSLENISEETIQKFILTKKETKAIETINLYIKALKVFLKFLKKDIELPKLFKPIEKVPDYIDLDYFEKQIIPVVECIFKNPLRTKAVLYFMFYTGLRRNELYTIKRKDIDLKEREVKIYAQKVKTEEVRFFPQKIADLIKTYFSVEPEINNAFNLFKNTVTNIFKTLKPHFKDIKLRPGLFRHSYATYLFEQGAGALDLQKFLGHKNIQSTLKYTNRNKTVMKKKYDEFTKRKR